MHTQFFHSGISSTLNLPLRLLERFGMTSQKPACLQGSMKFSLIQFVIPEAVSLLKSCELPKSFPKAKHSCVALAEAAHLMSEGTGCCGGPMWKPLFCGGCRAWSRATKGRCGSRSWLHHFLLPAMERAWQLAKDNADHTGFALLCKLRFGAIGAVVYERQKMFKQHRLGICLSVSARDVKTRQRARTVSVYLLKSAHLANEQRLPQLDFRKPCLCPRCTLSPHLFPTR